MPSPFQFTSSVSGVATSVVGTTTNDNAPAGYVGEYLSATGSTTPGASTAYKTVASLSLTAGDWDVWGNILLGSGTLSGGAGFGVGISLTNNSLDDNTGFNDPHYSIPTSNSIWHCSNMRRISIAATTTVYLVGRLVYSSLGTASFADSNLMARRRR